MPDFSLEKVMLMSNNDIPEVISFFIERSHEWRTSDENGNRSYFLLWSKIIWNIEILECFRRYGFKSMV